MKLLVVTGAGVSAASGIAMFRVGDDAVWAKDTMEKGTTAFFQRNPVSQWKWYEERFQKCVTAEPNAAHHALAEIEGRLGDRFLLVTQNIDTLHEKAGSKRLVKVHGSADKVRCSRKGCKCGAPRGYFARDDFADDFARFFANPVFTELPRCPVCNALIRPHVLWFDEFYNDHLSYEIERVSAFAKEADEVVFIGTTLQVGVCMAVLTAALGRGGVSPVPGEPARVTIVDPQRSPVLDVIPASHAEYVPAKAEEWLPELAKRV